MKTEINEIQGSYTLMRVGRDLSFERLPALQEALANGIRSGKIFWCLDCSAVEKISPAIIAVFVGVAGGLRAFGGDLVIYRESGRGSHLIDELKFSTYFRLISSLAVLEEDQPEFSPSFGGRSAMEAALLLYRNERDNYPLFRGERDKERILREEVPLASGRQIELYDSARNKFPGKVLQIDSADVPNPKIIVGELSLEGWAGDLARYDVISVRFRDGEYVYDNYAVEMIGRIAQDKIVLSAPLFFLRSDQRLHTRVETNLDAVVLPCDLARLKQPYSARVVSLSMSGCAFVADQMPPIGALLSLAFGAIELSGKVTRHVGGVCALGFFEMDLATRRTLAYLARS